MAFAIEEGERAADVLARLKDALPFTFRFQGAGARSRKPHPDMDAIITQGAAGPMTPRAAVAHIVSALPAAWQATALPGYIILYKEAPREYPQAQVIAISGDN